MSDAYAIRATLRRKGLTFALVATASAYLQACGTPAQVRMESATRDTVTSASQIDVVHYATPSLFLQTPKEAAGAGLLTAMTGSNELPSGAEIERTYGLPDAAEEIAGKLTTRLQSDGGLKNLHAGSALPLPWAEDPSHYRGQAGAPFVLEISIQQHSAGYQVLHWKTYYYWLVARARLVRVADTKVLWSNICWVGGPRSDTMTLDVSQFEANNAARLKELYHEGDEQCAKSLAETFLASGDKH